MKSYFIAFLLLVSYYSSGQIFGCTDPQSTNYNPQATINDGSCNYTVTTAPVTQLALLPNSINETSGLIKWNNHFITHNDNDDSKLYLLDTISGSVVGSYELPVQNNDWEEISQDQDYIYIGDIGNNSHGNRTDLKIIKVGKQSLLLNQPEIETITFAYQDQSDFSPAAANTTDFDCEAFFVTSEFIYLFTKEWTSKRTSIHRISNTAGSHLTEKIGTWNVQGLVTGATYIADKKLVALSGYSALLQPFVALMYDFKDEDFLSGNKRKINIPLAFHQIEGITTSNGLKFYLTNERIAQPAYLTIPAKLHSLDLSSAIGSYIDPASLQVNEHPIQDDAPIVFHDPVRQTIEIHVGRQYVGARYALYDLRGRRIIEKTIQSEVTTIPAHNYGKGIYELHLYSQKIFTVKLAI